MLHFYLRLSKVLLLALATLSISKAFGQTPPQKLSVRNFAVFGGFQVNTPPLFFSDSLNHGVSIGNNGTVNGGAVGSYTFITTGQDVLLKSNLFSGHRIRFGTGVTVFGNVTAAINGRQDIDVINSVGFATFGGVTDGPFFMAELIANGNIRLDPYASNVGTVRIPAGNTYQGPSPEMGIFNNPTFPQLPAVPPNLPWGGPGTGPDISKTSSINPGTHGSITLAGQQTITFNGPGRYIFDSMVSKSSGQNTFIFDFKNNETAIFGIFINKNADLRNIKVMMINGGSASRIYTEVRGTGLNNGYAFSIDGGPSTNAANWEGTVWAPLSKIRIGQAGDQGSVSVVNGCLWSARMVNLYGQATVNYVPLSISADPSQTLLSPIIPYYTPPASGKVAKIIGSELQSLAENYHPLLVVPNDFIYRIDKATNKVLIEVIAKVGQVEAVKKALIETYGLTDTISNGPGSLIITGKIPIANLVKLNTDAISQKIDYCRPLFLPLTNSGLVSTLGDSAMRTGLVRSGYNLSGSGVKVGVLSDSYAKAAPDPFTTPAANDLGVDLPASVDVLLDYPFGTASDEGRAMMQIVHDVAPAAQLAFRTGFISAGDMALGIHELANDCDIIVDDVTYITEPFLKDGMIAKAVNSVVNSNGVTYFSAAGNFGKKAYDGIFEEMIPPSGISGKAHDFGGGTYLQPVKLQPGSYTIVLQWFDDVYSLGETATGGAHTDLDIYLVDDLGTVLFGFNRVNIGGDPLEVLPFRVNGTVPINANLMIVRSGGPSTSLKFKYIVFRGGLSFTNYGGASTLVGQANSQGAIAVGAVAYDQTPPFGVTPATIEEFSSLGGTLINGVNRNKPDLTAPDRGNVTINIGPDYDTPPDGKANFFGTSAAAPHAAAAAALIREGKQKFSSINIAPVALKNLLKNTATDIGTNGYDPVTGSGLVNADAAMRTFANPQPHIGTFSIVESGITPGLVPFTVSVKGDNLSPTTVILFNNNPITTSFISAKEVQGSIPVFSGNPPLQLYTAPISSSSLDGGYSEERFFGEVLKKTIVITVNDKTRKFGETDPAFTSSISVDGVSLSLSGLTLSDLKLNSLSYNTTATATSQVGLYPINITNPIDPNDPLDQLLLAKYNYQFVSGVLQVGRLPLQITPQDKTINYGNYPGEVTFNYVFDKTRMANPNAIEEIVKNQHKKFLAENAIAVVNGFKLPQDNGSPLTDADLQNMSTMASFQAISNARKFVVRDGQVAPLTGLLNSDEIGLQRFYVDVSAKSIYNYKLNPASSPLETAFPGGHSRLLLNAKALANNTATTTLGNGQLQPMVNGQLLGMVNGQLQSIVNGQLMAIVNGELSVLENVAVLNGQLQAIVNGVSVVIPNGQLQALVNGQLFFVANPVIVNGQLQAIVNGQLMGIVNGQLMPIVNGQLMPIVNGQLQAIVNGQLMPIVNGQLQAIVNGQLLAIVNGELVVVTGVTILNGQLLGIVNGQLQPIVNGQLQAIVNGEVYSVQNLSLLNGQLQAIVNGQLMGIVNGQLQAIVNGQLQPIVNANNLGGTNSNNNTAVIVDEDDINLQDGFLGAMFSINMITGLDEGVQKLIPGAFGHENFDVTYGLGKVTILPPTHYYTKATGDLHNVSSWGANPDGSGSNPSDFGADKTFHLVNRGAVYTMTANWSVSGKLDIPAGSQLQINGHTLSKAGSLGSGKLYGSLTSNLVVTGALGDAELIAFETGGGNLNNLTFNPGVASASATVSSTLNIYGVLTVAKGALKTNNKVTLKSSEANTARVAPVTGSITGNVTVERYIPARRAWRIMSAPVSGNQSISAAWQEGATTSSANSNPKPGFGTHITEGSPATGFDHNPLGAAAVSIKKYVSATDTWDPLTNTNATAVNANAYLLFVRGDRGFPLSSNVAPPANTVLRATGPLKTGDQTFTVSAKGFTAIPNPYASPVNFATLTRNNVQNNFYLWDPKLGGEYGLGGYVLLSYNGTGYDITPAPVSPESQYIQSGQGFLVHSTGVEGSLVIKESDKSATAATNVFRSGNITGLRTTLQIANQNGATTMDETFSSYGPSFSNQVDEMDALKLPNINENLGIAKHGQTLMVERKKTITGNDTIHLKLWNTSPQQYMFRFSPLNLSSANVVAAYLEDAYLNTSTPVNLVEETVVVFTVNADPTSASPDRFRIVLSSGKTMVPETVDFTKGKFKISPNPLTGKSVNIQFVSQPRGTYNIELLNSVGQVVYRSQVKHDGGTATQTLQLNNRIAKGAYQMRVVNKSANIKFALPVLSN